jgi:hypothetical protein
LCRIDNVVAIISLCFVASVGSPLHHVVIGVVVVTLLHHVVGVVIASGGGGAIGQLVLLSVHCIVNVTINLSRC